MIKKVVINSKEQTVKNLILLSFPQLNSKQILKIFKNKDIKINGVRIKENLLLKKEDVVELFVDEKLFQFNPKIVYEDENILIVEKPVKCETVSLDKNAYTLEKIIQINYPNARVLHRLDINTKGLVIFSLNNKSYDCLLKIFKNHEIEKYYKAVVCGKNVENFAVLKDYITKNTSKNIVEVSNKKISNNSRFAILEYKCLQQKNELFLICIKLITGRTHQIRAQLAKHGIFVVGDGKYGDKIINRQYNIKYQQLCAYKLKFKIQSNSLLKYLNNLDFEIECNFDCFK